MTPTQAQIEAAAWLVCPNEIVRCTKLCGSCLHKAKKILTAAAEANDESEMEEMREVAEKYNLDPAKDFLAMLEDRQAIIAATIERCAQVADSLVIAEDQWKVAGKLIAAAIRALRDK